MVFLPARLKRSLLMASMLGGLVLSSAAFAQIDQLPGSADPARVFEEMERPPAPDQTLEQSAKQKKVVAQVPEGMENLRFVLRDLFLDGMTAYELAEVYPVYDQYMGQEISIATLFEIMAKIQQKYLDDGYALTDLPPIIQSSF